jgi:hypothetical protein
MVAAAARHDLEAFNRFNAYFAKTCFQISLQGGNKPQQNYMLVTDGTLAKL